MKFDLFRKKRLQHLLNVTINPKENDFSSKKQINSIERNFSMFIDDRIVQFAGQTNSLSNMNWNKISLNRWIDEKRIEENNDEKREETNHCKSKMKRREEKRRRRKKRRRGKMISRRSSSENGWRSSSTWNVLIDLFSSFLIHQWETIPRLPSSSSSSSSHIDDRLKQNQSPCGRTDHFSSNDNTRHFVSISNLTQPND